MSRLEPKPVEPECQSCKDNWDNKRPPEPRKRLVMIGATQNKKVAVLVCPYCDGERAIALAKAKPKK